MAKKVEEVKIEPIKIEEAVVTIVGDSPLIVHNFDEKTKRQLLEISMQKAKKPREPKNPVEDFIRSLHWLTPMPTEFTEEAFEEAIKNGARFGFPSVGVKASAVSGAYRGGYTKDKVSINGAFHIIGEFITINGSVPKMREDMCRVGMGAPDIRYRGEYSEWSMTFVIRYNKNAYSLEQILNFINLGGFSVGIGEWRPEKGGNNGMFHIAETK